MLNYFLENREDIKNKKSARLQGVMKEFGEDNGVIYMDKPEML